MPFGTDEPVDQFEEIRQQVAREMEMARTQLAGPRPPAVEEMYQAGADMLRQQQAIQAQGTPGIPPPVAPAVDLSQPPPGLEPGLEQLQAAEPPATMQQFGPTPSGTMPPEVPPLQPEYGDFWSNLATHFHDSATIGNASAYGTFLRDMGNVTNNPTISGAGNFLSEYSANATPWNKFEPLSITSLFDGASPPGTTDQYLAQQIGSALGTMLPFIGLGAGTAALGVSAPVTLGIAALGAALPLNYGDVRNSLDAQLKDQKIEVPENERILGSFVMSLPIAALDLVGASGIGALGEAQLKKSIIHRMAAKAAERFVGGKLIGTAVEATATGLGEGATEFTQQMLQEAYLAAYDVNPDWAEKFIHGLDAFVGGALVGGGVSVIMPGERPAPAAPPPPGAVPPVPPGTTGPAGGGTTTPPGTDTTTTPVQPPAPPVPPVDGPEPAVPPTVGPEPSAGPGVEPVAPTGTDAVEGTTPAAPGVEPPPPVTPTGPEPAAPAGVEPGVVPGPTPPPTQFSRGDRYIVVGEGIDLSTAQNTGIRLLTAPEAEQTIAAHPDMKLQLYRIDSAKVLPGMLGGSTVAYGYASPFLQDQAPQLWTALDAVLSSAQKAIFSRASKDLFAQNLSYQLDAVRALQDLDAELHKEGKQLPAIAGSLVYHGKIGDIASFAEPIAATSIDTEPGDLILTHEGLKGKGGHSVAGSAAVARLPKTLGDREVVSASAFVDSPELLEALKSHTFNATMSYNKQDYKIALELADLSMAMAKDPSVENIQKLLDLLHKLNVPMTYTGLGLTRSKQSLPMPMHWLGEGFMLRSSTANQMTEFGHLSKDDPAVAQQMEDSMPNHDGNIHHNAEGASEKAIVKFVKKIMTDYLPNINLVVEFTDSIFGATGTWGGPGFHYAPGVAIPTGWHHIKIVRGRPLGKMLITAAHETGHAISYGNFHKLPSQLIKQAYAAWRLKAAGLIVKAAEGGMEALPAQTGIGREIVDDSTVDWFGFCEWFSTQLEYTLPENQFVDAVNTLGPLKTALMAVFTEAYEKAGMKLSPDAIFRDVLDSFRDHPEVLAQASYQRELIESRENVDALNRAGLMDIAEPVPNGPATPKNMPVQMVPFAAYFNWAHKWLWNILQLAEMNRGIIPLQRYVEHLDGWQRARSHWMNKADQRLKDWRKLGKKQVQAVTDLIFEVQKMHYLPAGAAPRYPTSAELAAMAARHGVNSAGSAVYDSIIKDFRDLLIGVRDTLLADAARIHAGNPARSRQVQAEIVADFNKMLAKPYFPYARFGKYHVVVSDATGVSSYREGFQSERQAKRALKDIRNKILPHETVALRQIPDEFLPYMGLPPQLLDKIASQMHLTPAQEKQLKELTYELSPAHSFNRHFIRRDSIGGYSTDGMRVYADYFFHAANHIARIQYGPKLDDDIKAMGALLESQRTPGVDIDLTKGDEIKHAMEMHKNSTMNPGREWHMLRGLAFVWNFVLEPLSAGINLLQTPMVTAPYLARRYGDLKTMGALTTAARHIKGLYTTSTSSLTANEHRAVQAAIDQGVVDQSFAEDLASLSSENVLRGLYGGEAMDREVRRFMRIGAFMFHHAEKMQRYVSFLAAYRLAQQQPGKHPGLNVRKLDLITELTRQGWSPAEAHAFAAAKETVIDTHFEYARYAKPRFMQGRKSSVFVFMGYMQNMLWIIHRRPEKWRVLIGLLATSGLMGLPGAEDAVALAKALAYRFFGKNFDPEREAHQMLSHVTDHPDLILHGAGRYGFGMGMVGDMTGLPIPTGDVSGRLSMGRVVPGLGALADQFGPYGAKDIGGALGSVGTQASGAGFGLVFNLLNAVMHAGSPNASRYYEQAMPRVVRNGMAAYRMATQGEASTINGEPLSQFDLTDPHDLAQIAGQALGAPPTEVRQIGEQRRWVKEQMAFIDQQRSQLIEQFRQSVQTEDVESRAEVLEAVRDYNEAVGPLAKNKVITADTLRESVKNKATGEAIRRVTGEKTKSDSQLRAAIARLYGLQQASPQQ